MCEKLCQLSKVMKILPVCVDFKDAPDRWSCFPPSLTNDSDDRNAIEFSLSLVARMLYDRYEFNTLDDVRKLMWMNFLDATIAHEADASMLIQAALQLIRRKQDDTQFESVLIIVDESAQAVNGWPMSVGRLMSVLTKSTIHCPEKGISLFITSLSIEAFESDVTISKLKPVYLRPLNPHHIRDDWLKLVCSDVIVMDLITRLLAVLASVPRVIEDMKHKIELFARLDKSTASTAKTGQLVNHAVNSFKDWYGDTQEPYLEHITLDLLNALVMGKSIKLNKSVLDLVACSFLVNDVRVRVPQMEKNSIIPESALLF